MTLRAAFLTALPAPTRPTVAPPPPARRRRTLGRTLRLLLGVVVAAALLPLGHAVSIAEPHAGGAPPRAEIRGESAASQRYLAAMRYRFGGFEADPEAFELRRSGAAVALAPLPMKLLLHLLERHPAAPTREELMQTLWPDTAVSDASLAQAVRAVRSALADAGGADDVIRTVRGRGFKIGVPVQTEAPLPEAPDEVEEPLFGRGPELAQGTAAIDAALAGTPRFVVLIGEPGIGKTRLAERLARIARERGARVLQGRGHEGDREPAFWPFVQIVRDAASGLETPELLQCLGTSAAEIAAVVPEIADRLVGVKPATTPSDVDPEQARFAFFDGVTRFLARVAAKRPLALLVDDLHWADPGSLRLLEFFVQELPPSPILLVTTTRNVEMDPPAGLQAALAALARSPFGGLSLALDGLGREDLAQLVAAEVGQPPSPALLDAVVARTDGNPLFAREVAQWVADDDAGGAGPEIPAAVQQVIRHRLASLDDDSLAILGAAATVGREFDLGLVARALDRPADDVLAALEPAERARIVGPGAAGVATLRFSHALVRETLLADLSTRERVRLHARVGAALEALHAAHPERVLSELARHFAAALPVSDANVAFGYAARAAETNLRLLAFEQAAEDAELALTIADQAVGLAPEARSRVLRLLADAQFRAGRREQAAGTWWRLVAAARRLDDPEALADSAMSLAFANVFTAHSHEETIGLLREALDRLGPADGIRRARLLSWLARQITWTEEADRQDQLTREAVEMARRLGDEPTLLDVLGARGSILELGGDDEDREATCTELLELARRRGSRVFEADALTLRLQHRIELADARGIDRDLDVCERLARDLRHPFYIAHAARARAMRALWRGDLQEAEGLVQHAFELGQRVDPEHAAVALSAQLGALRRLQGRVGELEAGAREAADRYPMMASFRCGLAAIELETGNEAAARRTFESLARGGFPEIRPDRPNHGLNLALASEVCAQLGQVEHARTLVTLLEPFAGRYLTAPNVVAAGTASRHLGALHGALGAFDLAEAHFETALDIERGMAADAWLAATHVDHARVRLAAGEAQAARASLDEALAIATRKALVGLAAAANRLTAELEVSA